MVLVANKGIDSGHFAFQLKILVEKLKKKVKRWMVLGWKEHCFPTSIQLVLTKQYLLYWSCFKFYLLWFFFVYFDCVFVLHETISMCSHSCRTLPWLFLIGSELHMLQIGLYGTLFWQAPCKFLLDLSFKGSIDSNSHYIKFISRMKESIKCPTAMSTPGNPCNVYN